MFVEGLVLLTDLRIIWEEFLSVHLQYMTAFDRPEVTLCGWQDVKIQLLTTLEEKIFFFFNDGPIHFAARGLTPVH